MRLAFISDVHANLQAWEAVVRDLRHQSPDMCLNLGDPVGYGPNPQAVLDQVRERCAGSVLGDHDAVITGSLEREIFDEESLRLIDWTRDNLDDEAIKFLASLPHKMGDDDLLCVHSDPSNPDGFSFVDTQSAAAEAFAAARQSLIFVGHTHVSGVYQEIAPGSATWLGNSDLILEPDTRYLINPGSVGDPLDNSPRASYCLYDTDTRQLTFRRVPFAFENYRKAIADAKTDVKPRCLSLMNAKFSSGEPPPPKSPHDGRTGLLKRIPRPTKPQVAVVSPPRTTAKFTPGKPPSKPPK